MKNKIILTMLACVAGAFCAFAAEENTPPPADPPPVPTAPAETPAPVPADPANPAPAPVPKVTTEGLPATGDALPVAAREIEVAAAETNLAAVATAPAGAAVPAGPSPTDIVPLIVIDDVPLTDAIRNLARQSGLNFQFDPRITSVGGDGKPTNQVNISIRFENVTAQEALGAVLENYGLVLVQDQKSRIARVTIKDPKAEDPLISSIVQLKFSDPTNLTTIVKSALSPRSQVVSDPRTSQLIITTTGKEMEGILNLIEKLDTPTRQVLIEARLLESSRNPSTVRGIDWAGTLEAQNFSGGNNTITPSSSVSDNKLVANSAPALLVDTARGFNPRTAFLDADGVKAVLSFFNKDADTEVVATPRAVTLDNQTAMLSVTRAFPIFKVTPGSANSPAGAEVTYTNLGTILHVTPRIAADRNISLKVIPEVSNIDSIDKQVLNGQQNTANIYAIRRIEANVLIPSGHTLVMGGLISDRRTKGFSKVPILGDIPLAGGLFRKQSKSQDKSNLIIFITPTIVEDADFAPNATSGEFLKTPIVETTDLKPSFLENARPYDWSKPHH